MNHITHMLKHIFIKLMVVNLVVKNMGVAYVANLCFRNALSISGKSISEIISEYKLDYELLQFPHIFNIKAKMDIMYRDTISANIHGEEWKIIMILKIAEPYTLHSSPFMTWTMMV